jgi:hypothetical protein
MFVLAVLILKQQANDLFLVVDALSGSHVEIYECRNMDSVESLFAKWRSHFINFVKPPAEHKMLLAVHWHAMHSKNLKAIELAVKGEIIVLQLPDRATHRPQALDVSISKPLESVYNRQSINGCVPVPADVTQVQASSQLSEADPFQCSRVIPITGRGGL